MRTRYLLAAIVLLPILTGRAENSIYERFRIYVQTRVDEDNIPGAAAALVHDGRIVFCQGFGYRDLSAQLPATPQTLFHIGSLNKALTASMIAALVDEGLFTWDTPVVQIFPDFRLKDTTGTQNTTMRYLLTMRAGIPDYAEDDLPWDAPPYEVFPVLANADRLGAPGSVFEYSNLSYAGAGFMAALATGSTTNNMYDGYASLLQQYLLNPMGMTNSVVRLSEAQANPNYGKSYRLSGGVPVEAPTEDLDDDPLAPAGTLKASVADMALYLLTQLGQGQAPNGQRVVSTTNTLVTWTPGLEDYAMGWEHSSYRGQTLIWHEGAFDYYLGVMGFVTNLDMGFIVLANCERAAETLIAGVPDVAIDLFLEQTSHTHRVSVDWTGDTNTQFRITVSPSLTPWITNTILSAIPSQTGTNHYEFTDQGARQLYYRVASTNTLPPTILGFGVDSIR